MGRYAGHIFIANQDPENTKQLAIEFRNMMLKLILEHYSEEERALIIDRIQEEKNKA